MTTKARRLNEQKHNIDLPTISSDSRSRGRKAISGIAIVAGRRYVSDLYAIQVEHLPAVYAQEAYDELIEEEKQKLAEQEKKNA